MSRRQPEWTPPARDGLNASRVAVHAPAGTRVLDFLQARLPFVQDWGERLARGVVLDVQGQVVPPSAICVAGMHLWYWREVMHEERVPFDIEVVFHDEHLVVVDKPHFLPVVPSGRHVRETVLVRLQHTLNLPTLAPMHRLDRETAGLVLFTVQPGERGRYQELLRHRAIDKTYEAIAAYADPAQLPDVARHRLVEQDGERFMQMRVDVGDDIRRDAVSATAETEVTLLRRVSATRHAADLALYRLKPLTGRKHQLRAQMNALGLPLVGDRIYPVLWPTLPPGTPEDFQNPLQLLAKSLSFTDPVTGEERQFHSRRRLALDA